MFVENPMTVEGVNVQIGTLAAGDTFLLIGEVYGLLGTGFTASSGGIPIFKLSDFSMGPNVNSATLVIPYPMKATPE